MKQTVVRGIDPALARGLRKEARRRGLSLNRTILLLLRQAAGLEKPPDGDAARPRRFADLDHLIGTWSKEEADAFDGATADVRRIEPEMWK